MVAYSRIMNQGHKLVVKFPAQNFVYSFQSAHACPYILVDESNSHRHMDLPQKMTGTINLTRPRRKKLFKSIKEAYSWHGVSKIKEKELVRILTSISTWSYSNYYYYGFKTLKFVFIYFLTSLRNYCDDCLGHCMNNRVKVDWRISKNWERRRYWREREMC